jgi:heme-degrading monooxygenase HmoA
MLLLLAAYLKKQGFDGLWRFLQHKRDAFEALAHRLDPIITNITGFTSADLLGTTDDDVEMIVLD